MAATEEMWMPREVSDFSCSPACIFSMLKLGGTRKKKKKFTKFYDRGSTYRNDGEC